MEFNTKKLRIYRHAETTIKYLYFITIKVLKTKYLDRIVCKSSKLYKIKKNHCLLVAVVACTLNSRMMNSIYKIRI